MVGWWSDPLSSPLWTLAVAGHYSMLFSDIPSLHSLLFTLPPPRILVNPTWLSLRWCLIFILIIFFLIFKIYFWYSSQDYIIFYFQIHRRVKMILLFARALHPSSTIFLFAFYLILQKLKPLRLKNGVHWRKFQQKSSMRWLCS